jgi:hypothetical protein
MIRLNLPKDSRWLDLPMGVRVKVKPLSTPVYEACRFEADRRVRAIRTEMIEAKAAGATVKGLPDLNDDSALAGFSQFIFVQCLACAAIDDWKGVLCVDSDYPEPLTHDGINDLMRIHTMADSFLDQYVNDWGKIFVEGRPSVPGSNGTSGTENIAVPDTATDAGKTKPLAVEEK